MISQEEPGIYPILAFKVISLFSRQSAMPMAEKIDAALCRQAN